MMGDIDYYGDDEEDNDDDYLNNQSAKEIMYLTRQNEHTQRSYSSVD